MLFLMVCSFGQTEKNNIKTHLDSMYFSEMMQRRVVDDFTHEIKIDCPVLGNSKNTIHLQKSILNGRILYLIDFMVKAPSCVVNGQGVSILFTDGTQITRPLEKIDVDASDGGFEYTALFKLTIDEVKSFSLKTVNKFRLEIFDGVVNAKDAEDFKIYAKNIVLTK
jgi:hypothetical protein